MFKIIFNSILYIFLTGCIIFYFAKDKYLNSKIEKIRNPLLKKVFSKFNITKKSNRKRIVGAFDWIQTIVVALILVFIIQTFYLANYTVPTGSMYPTIKPGERFFADKVSYKFKEPERGDIIVFKEPFTDKDRYTKRLIGLPGEQVSIGDGNIYIDGKKLSMSNKFSYYNDNTLIADNVWKIPQFGDSIKLVEGIFRYNDKRIILSSLQDKLEEDKSIINDIIIVDAKFILNDDSLTGPIYDRDILLKLINGNEVKLNSDYYFALGDNSQNSFDSRYWGFISENRLLGKMLFRFWPLSEFGWVR